MNDGRNYASLSSGLLARKGTAKPAMRPQPYGNLEDLGWNDMGYGHPDEPEPAPLPVDHVPSSIAALTPAPRNGEIDPESFYGEEEEGDLEAQAETPEFAPIVAKAAREVVEEEPCEAEDYEAEAYETEEDPIEAVAEVEVEIEAEAEAEAEPAAREDYSVVAQQRAILERFDRAEESEAAFEAELEPVMVPARKAQAIRADVVPLPKREAIVAASRGRKAAFTLRLDADRHLRLRLACAVTGHSAQQIVTDALDSALAAIPEIEALAARVPVKAGSGRAKRN